MLQKLLFKLVVYVCIFHKRRLKMSESPSTTVQWDIYNFPMPAITEEELAARKANLLEAAKRDIAWRYDSIFEMAVSMLSISQPVD